MQVQLTPSSNRYLGHVVFVVCVEHPDHQQVEVEGLHGHPRETTQQGVVHDDCDKQTHPVGLQRGRPLAQHEGGVEQEQGTTQGHMDGNGMVHFVSKRYRQGQSWRLWANVFVDT